MTTRNDSTVEEAYNLWSDTYDTDTNATRDLDAVVLRSQQLPLQGSDVLEIGCGTGKNTEYLARSAKNLLAFDLSDRMLSKARQRVSASHVRFEKQDLCVPWAIENASQDCVIGNLVLEHIEDLQPLFREAARVLRPGGHLFLCELHPFRQLQGAQAQFTPQGTTERQRVVAYLHNVSDYVNGALAQGFQLQDLREWRDPSATTNALPRLLSCLWIR